MLGVSWSGYYAWKTRTFSVSERCKEKVIDSIMDIYEGSHHNYGASKIIKKLAEQGKHISEKTVDNYMRQMGIKAHWARYYTPTTIHPDLSNQLSNILDEQFDPVKPDTVWVSDITYIWTVDLAQIYFVTEVGSIKEKMFGIKSANC